MSVEDIQKINKLAQELLDHGLVASRNDAVKRAEEMLNKKLAEAQEDSQGQAVTSDGSIKAPDDPDYYRNIIERTRDQVQREMKGFSEMLTLLASEVDAIKDEIRNLKVNFKPQPQENVKEEVDNELKEEVSEEKEEQTQIVDKEESSKEEKSDEPHPKRGNFNSDDVAIEKMFYYGNK